MNLGVIGIAFAMVADWAVKAGLIWTRYRGGKWKTFQVI
jgi:Na+-driven multidrug efflux pump